MTTRLTHVAINADDLDASQRFYAGVLGLHFAPYLGSEFLRTELDGVLVALQRRRSIGGLSANAPECTFAVEDVEGAAEAAQTLGGRILMAPTAIPNAGTLTFMTDPAGNLIGAMAYGRP